MNGSRRIVLWLGSPSWLILLVKRHGAWGVAGATRGMDSARQDFEAMGQWVAGHLVRGMVVDVVHQRHLLRVDDFGAREVRTLGRALEERLAQGLGGFAADMLLHCVTLPAREGTQVVTAGILKSMHNRIRGGLEGAGLHLGHVGFAGQLAVKAFLPSAAPGCWTVVDDAALADHLVLAAQADGRLMAEGYPVGGIDLDEGIPELMRLAPLAQEHSPIRMDLAATQAAAGHWIAAEGIPPLVSLALPVFHREKDWRVNATRPWWRPAVERAGRVMALGVALGLLVQTALLFGELSRRRQLHRLQAQLEAERASLIATRGRQLERQRELTPLQPPLDGLADEPLDDGAWIRFLARVRDRFAPDLAVDEVSLEGPAIGLGGHCASDQTPAAMADALERILPGGIVLLGPVTRRAANDYTYTIHLRRDDAPAPALARVAD